MISASDLATAYFKWIKETIEFSSIDSGTIRIDTPFYDRHNDSLILYALPENDDKLTLTDGGYTLDDLEMDNIFVTNSKKRKNILNDQLSAYGVKLDLDNNFLYLDSSISNFPSDKHKLLQAMLFTNDLFLTSRRNTKRIFLEDVQAFFDDNDIRALPDASFMGSTGLTHKFEFSIAGNPKKGVKDKLIKTLNSPSNEMYAKVLATDVRYTKEIMKRPTTFYTIINNSEKPISKSILALLNNENIKTIPFKDRKKFVPELSA